MDRTLLFIIEFWAVIGALIGGVVTPLVVENKKFNEWLAMLLGVVIGAVGNVFLLVPFWLLLSRLPEDERTPLRWQRDAISGEEAAQQIGQSMPLESLRGLSTVLVQNFWPVRREDHEHSHRSTYILVFLTLVIITAIEVTITYLDLPFSPAGPLAALSTMKVLLVAMYFMHLRFDSKWYTAIFVFSLPFAAMVLAVLALS